MYNDRGRGHISIPYILTFAVAVLLVVALAARQVTRVTSTRVVVARAGLVAGERVDASKLTVADVAKGAVPAGAILDPAVLLGHVIQRAVAVGHPITATDFSPPPSARNWLSDAPPLGRIVVTVSTPGTLIPVQQLRLGDQFELLGVTQQGESKVIARDAYYLGAIQAARREAPKGPLENLVQSANHDRRPTGVIGLVLAVRPQDVTPIAETQAKGDAITLALHGSKEILSGRLLQIAPQRVHTSVAAGPDRVELIAGAHREKVDLH